MSVDEPTEPQRGNHDPLAQGSGAPSAGSRHVAGGKGEGEDEDASAAGATARFGTTPDRWR